MNNSQQNITTAKQLLAWNSANLVAHADLQKSDIGKLFAPRFRVKANGKDIEGNHDNYYDFLNFFRATIKSIDYELDELIVDEDHVVIPMIANIVRTNDDREKFSAILILKFNADNKIVLWQEVYIQIGNTP